MKSKYKKIGIIGIAILALLIVGCTNENEEGSENPESVGESLNYEIVGVEPGAGIMRLGNKTLEEYGLAGDYEIQIGSGLPSHDDFYEDYKDDFVELSDNLEGARSGFVVPAYMDIDSIEDLAD